jgi:hypothetical protein
VEDSARIRSGPDTRRAVGVLSKVWAGRDMEQLRKRKATVYWDKSSVFEVIHFYGKGVFQPSGLFLYAHPPV